MAFTLKDKDNGWKQFKKRVAQLKGIDLTIGVDERLAETTVAPGVTLARLATIHEFGTADGRIKERSFIRSTMDVNRRKYEKMLDAAVKRVVEKKKAPKTELSKLGDRVKKDVVGRILRKEIRQELSPLTIARKGHDVALFDTGRLVGSIVSKVEKK